MKSNCCNADCKFGLCEHCDSWLSHEQFISCSCDSRADVLEFNNDGSVKKIICRLCKKEEFIKNEI